MSPVYPLRRRAPLSWRSERHLGAGVIVSALLLLAGCSFDETGGAADREPIDQTEVQQTVASNCSSGFEQAFSGRSDGDGFSTTGAVGPGPVQVTICKNGDGRLEYIGQSIADGASIRLDACQDSPQVWSATNGDIRYVVVDERESQRSIPGVVTQYDPDGTSIQWLLEFDISRDTALQDGPAIGC